MFEWNARIQWPIRACILIAQASHIWRGSVSTCAASATASAASRSELPIQAVTHTLPTASLCCSASYSCRLSRVPLLARWWLLCSPDAAVVLDRRSQPSTLCLCWLAFAADGRCNSVSASCVSATTCPGRQHASMHTFLCNMLTQRDLQTCWKPVHRHFCSQCEPP